MDPENTEGTGTEEVSQETTEATTTPAGPVVYTPEELAALTPTDIDLERVDPASRPIVENTIRDYKALQADYTKKSQRLAELEKTVPAEPETYFGDANKDRVFKDYIAAPLKVVSDINAEITRLEGVTPYDDDGNPNPKAYREARTAIAYWQGVKDEFSMKRQEINDLKRAGESNLSSLGEDAQAIVDYGKSLGFSEKDLKARPALLSSVKGLYATANAAKTALKKEVKPAPQKAATPAGQAAGGAAAPVIDTSKMSDAEWFAHRQKEQRERVQKRLGG